MITGFNTDIPHEGVTYHVQTEDKGLETPLILSLVYVGGAILASKRTLYQDLIEAGFDEKLLTERLQRQHKLICAAIRAGRIEDLKRMSERTTESRQSAAPTPPAPPPAPSPASKSAPPAFVFGEDQYSAPIVTPSPVFAPGEATHQQANAPVVSRAMEMAPPLVMPLEQADVIPFDEDAASDTQETEDDEIYLSLLEDDGDFRAGQLATIKIHVGRGQYGTSALANADVTIKVLGTTFRPLILTTKTDAEGVAVVRAMLPRFTSGRAAIIIRASEGDDHAELRRIIHQS